MRTQVVPGAQPESSGIRWNWQSTGTRRQVLVTRRNVQKGRFKPTLMEAILVVTAYCIDTGPSGWESLCKSCHRALFRASNQSPFPEKCAWSYGTVLLGQAVSDGPSWSRACDVRNGELGLPLLGLSCRPAAGDSLTSPPVTQRLKQTCLLISRGDKHLQSPICSRSV